MLQSNDCGCVIYECTVSGEGAIIWTGSAFDCISTGNEIALLSFDQQSVVCNNGLKAQRNNYTSLLMITDSSLSGKNTECIYYNETNPEVIGKSSIPTIMANSREYVLLLLVMQPDLYIILFTCRAPITTY